MALSAQPAVVQIEIPEAISCWKVCSLFLLFRTKAIVEVDGGQHSGDPLNDALRADYLGKEGYQIVRFWNHEVLQNTEGVLEMIARTLKSPSPQSSPSRERR